MSKSHKKNRSDKHIEESRDNNTGKISRKYYEEELEKLQAELVKLQFWTRETGAKVVVIFEGRDAAGKGGVAECVKHIWHT